MIFVSMLNLKDKLKQWLYNWCYNYVRKRGGFPNKINVPINTYNSIDIRVDYSIEPNSISSREHLVLKANVDIKQDILKEIEPYINITEKDDDWDNSYGFRNTIYTAKITVIDKRKDLNK